MSVNAKSVITIAASRKPTGFFIQLLSKLLRQKPLGFIGGIITLLLLFTGIFASFLAPYGYNEAGGPYLAPPSNEYLLGTDNLGRDILSRIIYGARLSVLIGLTATMLSTFISLVIGALSGYLGGVFDLVVQRFVDAWMCFPGLILLLIMVSVLSPGAVSIVLVLSLSFGISGSRVIRGAVIGIKEDLYVKAAVTVGCTDTRVLLRHILPNIMAPLIILFSTRVPGVILAEASMSFLGLGIPPPAPSWGGMLSGAARRYMFLAPGMAIWPGVALSVVVFGVNMFGDALRDLLDPKLHGGGGRYTQSVKKGGKKQGTSDSSEKNSMAHPDKNSSK